MHSSTSTAGVARRGDQLRHHILWVAKDVFLEMGFERASMDVIATRAETSKRTLYAHFKNKQKLYLAVIELVRALFLSKLKLPGDYSDDPEQALVLFCARYLEIGLYSASVRMCRMTIAEAERFPKAAAHHFDVIFTEVEARLATYLKKTFALTKKSASQAAERLMGRVLSPRYLRALFGVDELGPIFDAEALSPHFDLKPIRKAVAELLASLE